MAGYRFPFAESTKELLRNIFRFGRRKNFRVLEEFSHQHVVAPIGYFAGHLGQLTNCKYLQSGAIAHLTRTETAPYNEEVFEWEALLSAVLEVNGAFTMVDLGAGYGRWLVSAVCAVRQRRPSIVFHLVGVEAEPTHFEWMRENLATNGIDPASQTLICAAVHPTNDRVHFTIGHAAEWYGQAVIAKDQAFGNWPQARVEQVDTVTIRQLLEPLDVVDFLDADIQGAELECIRADIEPMTRKVRRACIATHSKETHEEVGRIFRASGWRCEAAIPLGPAVPTPLGPMHMIDGVQSWRNPALL